MTLLDHALKFAARGLPVFPCGPDKKPLTAHGFKDATCDQESIRGWWTHWPEASIGLPTGAISGVVVLDVDQDMTTQKDGQATLARLLAAHGEELPSTREASTPRGGRHIYFKHPGVRVPSRTNWPGQALDVRGDGGYVILPPSRIGTGVYAWVKSEESAPLPPWLREKLVEGPGTAHRSEGESNGGERCGLPRWAEQLLANGASSGERNAQAFRVSCQLRDAGLSESEAGDQMLRFAGRCSPPLPPHEALATLRSAYSQPARLPARSIKRPSSGLRAEYFPAEGEQIQLPEPVKWPAPIHRAAFHGLAGEVVRTIEAHTEADPAALLAMFLAAFGSMAGAGPHFLAESRRHPGRVWVVLVGETAKGRKGSAWSSLLHVLKRLDEGWCNDRLASGLSSGEGLIWAVRDEITRVKRSKDGSTEMILEDEGIADKRLLCIEEEFSSVLKVSAREANIVSDILRRAWDDGNLRTLTKSCPARATDAHITVVGHITKAELCRLLTETDTLNGFGNRFLWVAVRRSKLLPDGGALHTVQLDDLVLRLARALAKARTCTQITRTPAASEFWHAIYPVLTGDRPGLLGAITNRAEAQVMRLALVYALLDERTEIDVEHLRAGLALWDYCERSSLFVFGDSLGDKVADQLTDHLQAAGAEGMTLTQIRDLFGRNETGKRISEALGLLARLKLAQSMKKTVGSNGGRPAVVWKWSSDRNDIDDGTHEDGPLTSYSSFLSSEARSESRPSTDQREPAPDSRPVESEEEVYV